MYNIRGIIHAVRICIYAYGCGQILELHTEVVEFIGGEEDHVEDLYHEGGKGKLLLGVEDLRECAVNGMRPNIDAQLPTNKTELQ